MSNWDNEPVPERKWAIRDRVPLRQTGLFSGEGGTGKSILEERPIRPERASRLGCSCQTRAKIEYNYIDHVTHPLGNGPSDWSFEIFV